MYAYPTMRIPTCTLYSLAPFVSVSSKAEIGDILEMRQVYQ